MSETGRARTRAAAHLVEDPMGKEVDLVRHGAHLDVLREEPMSGPPCSEWTSPIHSGGSAIESSLKDTLKPACTTALERVR